MSPSRTVYETPRVAAKPGESEALEVLAFILGHGNTSRLYRTLVEERGLAVGAGGWYSGNALDLKTAYELMTDASVGVTTLNQDPREIEVGDIGDLEILGTHPT